MTDTSEKLEKFMAEMGMKPEDLEEHPDDRFEEEIDEYERMVQLLSGRGYSAAAPLVAAQLISSIRLGEIETAIASFSDNLMFHLETAHSSGGALKWSTEELLKHYNPEILEMIKDGTANIEVYEDRVVLKRKPEA